MARDCEARFHQQRTAGASERATQIGIVCASGIGARCHSCRRWRQHAPVQRDRVLPVRRDDRAWSRRTPVQGLQGEIDVSVADDIVNGFLCMVCTGVINSESPGHPRCCSPMCEATVAHQGRRKKQPKAPRCSTCGRMFKNPLALNQHCDSVHGGKSNQWLCAACGRLFSTQYALMQHVGSDTRQTTCATCGKVLGSHKALRDHCETTRHGFPKTDGA